MTKRLVPNVKIFTFICVSNKTIDGYHRNFIVDVISTSME